MGRQGAKKQRWAPGWRVIAVWSCGLLTACIHGSASTPDSQSPAEKPGAGARPDPPPATEPSAPAQTKESRPPARTWTLEVQGFAPALVYTPEGDATLPVWFAAHGAGGSAQEQLNYWSRLLRDQYIIVSLAGVPLYNKYPERGHYYTDHGALARELDAVSAKLRDETLPYAHRLAPGPFLFGAYSQGATMGALVLVERPEAFQRMILIEGGYEGWTKSRAQRFQAGGGQKVLWVCGTASCVRHAEAASQVARQAGLTAQVEWVEGGGHAYWGRVEDRVTERLSWLLE